jgi:hypothetical protein
MAADWNANKPAFSALFVSIDRKLDHPASNTDFSQSCTAKTFNRSRERLRHILITANSLLKQKSFLLSAILC